MFVPEDEWRCYSETKSPGSSMAEFTSSRSLHPESEMKPFSCEANHETDMPVTFSVIMYALDQQPQRVELEATADGVRNSGGGQ